MVFSCWQFMMMYDCMGSSVLFFVSCRELFAALIGFVVHGLWGLNEFEEYWLVGIRCLLCGWFVNCEAWLLLFYGCVWLVLIVWAMECCVCWYNNCSYDDSFICVCILVPREGRVNGGFLVAGLLFMFHIGSLYRLWVCVTERLWRWALCVLESCICDWQLPLYW